MAKSMTWDEAQAARKRNTKVLNAFLPQTLDERKAKLKDRMAQAWPTFGRCGLGDLFHSPLISQHHDAGTILRFFASDDPPTFHPTGVVKHGAYWWTSAVDDTLPEKVTGTQLQKWLIENKLNWVVLI